MRVFAISDLHLDYPVNKQWLQALSTTEYQLDVLIVAGDVAEDFALLRWATGKVQSWLHEGKFDDADAYR